MGGLLPRQRIIELLQANPPLISPVPDQATQKRDFDDHFQAASYDLRVGRIFTPSGERAEHTLKPGEITTILTLEILCLPREVAAFAYPPNFLSEQGLLVLNPGHVDPGYHGPLSVRLINLRKTPFVLHRGQPIFTVVFEELTAPTDRAFPEARQLNEEARARRVRQLVQDTMSESLFDLQATRFEQQFERLEADFREKYVKRDDLLGLWLKKSWHILVVSLAGLVAIIRGLDTMIEFVKKLLFKQ